MLDCGKPVASSVVDNLPSIVNRHGYPHVPEPEVAVIFRTKGSTEVDMNQLEMQLRAAKKEVLYNLFCGHSVKLLAIDCLMMAACFFSGI